MTARSTALAKNGLMQGTPKDTIPVKSPRRQRSSRFFVRNAVELEQYPNFQGKTLFFFFLVTDTNKRLTTLPSRGPAFPTPGPAYQETQTMPSVIRL